ncbi:uncharacterized protein [Panulirus ornatus]|uniref:uncharacterized protein isoform X2 n=1 Tax=Panulirus ornatus TaxID=150431 RepID=UPI003A85EC45
MMSGMPGPAPTVILPRPDLTLHRAPPLTLPRAPPIRPARAHKRLSLRSVPEEWKGALHRSSGSCEVSLSRAEHRVSTASDDAPNQADMSTFRNTSIRSWASSSVRSRTANSIRSRTSGSLRSRTSSTLQRSLRRAGPLYRSASTRVSSARRWAAALRKRVAGGGAAPLLTPARARRRRPVAAVSRGRPSPRAARNSPRVRAARRATSVASSVRWEVASGLAALLECAASAGSAAVAGVVRVCAAAVAMADAKLQQLRRSISSWSLSTFKKPKITISKLKAPKIKIFGGRKKNRVDPKDEAVALEEVKAALLKAEGGEEARVPGQEEAAADGAEEAEGEAFHDPSAEGGEADEAQPTILLTVHDQDYAPGPPPPPPSPGLLCANHDIEFIDSDDADNDERIAEAFGADIEYSDQWFDARGTLTRSKNDLARVVDDYDECRASRYYDAADESTSRPRQESLVTQEGLRGERGSQKAREWVKSFNEGEAKQGEQSLKLEKTSEPSSLTKSKSETRLDGIEGQPEKWSNRDKICLNATGGKDDYDSYLRREYNANVGIKEIERQKASEKEETSRRESLKKIFHVRGKLSIKPIVDSQRSTYTDTDIHIASAPYALANTPGSSGTNQLDGESLDVSDDGINDNSIDLDPGKELGHTVGAITKETKSEDGTKSKKTLTCDVTTVPDIVIDSPGACEREIQFPKQVVRRDTPETDDVPLTQSEAVSTEPIPSESGDTSTLNEVTWTENEESYRGIVKGHQDHESKLMAKESEMTTKDPDKDAGSESVVNGFDATQPNVNEDSVTGEKKETCEDVKEQERPDVAKTAKAESSSEAGKQEPKKRKISGANISKSIKSFAGSLFSQQTSSKGTKDTGEEKDGNKPKKKGRISPFTKDYLFRSSAKTAPTEEAVDGNSQSETKSAPECKSDIQVTQAKDDPPKHDEDNSLTEEAPDASAEDVTTTAIPEQVEAGDDFTNTTKKEAMPDLLPLPATTPVENTLRESPDSLEYISTMEPYEQKSISNESSPGIETSFVEEGGLRLRKDALLAINSMENDDTSTRYYSLLSDPDDSRTPTTEVEQNHQEQTLRNEVSQGTSLPVGPSQLEDISDVLTNEEPMLDAEVKDILKNDVHEIGKIIPAKPPQTEKPMLIEEQTPENKTVETLEREVNESDKRTVKTTDSYATVNKPRPPQVSTALPQPSGVTQKSSAVEEVAVRSNEVAPPEVPKMKLDVTAPVVSQEPPKPSPRNRKGKYGYSTATATPTTTTAPVATKPDTEKPEERENSDTLNKNGIKVPPSRVVESSQISTFPRRSASCKKAPAVEQERISSDSGYAGPGSTYYGGTDSEPIYWEISETKGAPPRPSPRTKKGQRTPSEPSLSQNVAPSPPSLTPAPASAAAPPEPHMVPEWINKRAPIPSPRTKKQRSLQSLPTVVRSDETMEAVKKKLQLMSHEPLQDLCVPQPVAKRAAEEEERFYSGKAASISYGFTPVRATPPSPPMRGRKASQVSLPAAMAADEALWRQQKRRSVHGGDNRGTNAQRPPSVRRLRRRTDPTQGAPIPSLKKAVQTEELLTDVLYSIHSLMGGASGGVWAVSGPLVLAAASAGGQTSSGSSNRTSVSLDQVTQVLKEAFQVSQDTLDRLSEEVQSRPAPEVSLHVNLKEAKDLRPKTVKGTTNSYVTLTVPSTGKSHRTRLEKDTLNPKWNQDFTLPVVNLQKDHLHLEVWHEHDLVGVKQLTAVRDIKGLSRLVRGTTAQAQHHSSHLLGQIMINVKEVSEHGVDGWHSLKKSEGEVAKDRGSIHMVASVSSSAHLENKSRQSYGALLARLIHHQLTAATVDIQESEWSTPWNGRVSSSAAAALAQYAIMLDLNDAALQLSWWCVGSRVATVDAAWTLSQLHRVQTALSKGAYQDEDLNELQSSFLVFVRAHAERLKDLHTAFPPSSGVLAQHQLTFTLKALQSIQNHADSRALVDQEGLPHVHEIVNSSLTVHAKNWWMLMIEEQLRGVKTADEQISRVINIVAESHTFLTHAANFYDGIFLKEMNIPYMQTTYLMVTKKINPCVRPLVMNIYNRMPAISDQMEIDDDVQYALEVGTSLWQLYRNLGRLHTLSESLPAEARAESGVCEYHRWFSRGVMRWLELAMLRAQDMIKRAVDLDCFEPVDAFCDFSSSATDTTGIFHDIKIWWLKLAWPDPENTAVLLAKILEDICSCGTTYSDLLTDKVDSMFRRQENSNRVFITKQICVGLNNIERVRRELTRLPAHFGFDDLLLEIKNSGSGNGAASQLESTVKRLIFSAAENMEAKVNAFIETVIEKMRPTLDNAVNDACEEQSGAPLLDQVLDPALEVLRNHLHTSNFHRFLWRVWEVIIDLFHATVMKNTERKAGFFGGVYSILETTLKFFSPSSGVGLEENAAQIEKYSALKELLESLRMTTEELISKYYQERYEEQVEDILPSKAQLVAKMLFTRPGRLIVEVIMARDIVVESDTISISSRGGLHGPYHNQSVDSYVKVQLVPQEWFPAAAIRKTKMQRKQDPAVYEESFEYAMGKNDDGVRAGFLLLTLKHYNLGRTNTFIGEALIPLADLPCVDSSEVHTIANTYLKLTTPGLDIGYKSLRALQFRTGDKTASAFLKKVSKRVLDSKAKGSTTLRTEEDKSRSKSPTLKERLKFS